MKWPSELTLIRHGQSAYNALRDEKEKDQDYLRFKNLYGRDAANNFNFTPETIALAAELHKRYRPTIGDEKTPLTELGHKQSYKTGLALSATTLPKVIFISPYLRAKQTLAGIIRGWPALTSVRVIEDERIREREVGIREIYGDWRFMNVSYPDQGRLHQLRDLFRYAPPQGESMYDVQLRNRSFFQTLTREFSGKKVFVVSHGHTILGIRSLQERWMAEKFIEMDRENAPQNCSITLYRCDQTRGANGKLVLIEYNKILY